MTKNKKTTFFRRNITNMHTKEVKEIKEIKLKHLSEKQNELKQELKKIKLKHLSEHGINHSFAVLDGNPLKYLIDLRYENAYLGM